MSDNHDHHNSYNLQQEQLEGRVTGVERDIQHMSVAVTTLAETVNTGFRESREQMSAFNRRQDERTSELHTRFDKQVEKRQWNPTLTIAFITCSILIGGMFVAFVQMTTAPLAKDDMETRSALDDHIRLGGHTEALRHQSIFLNQLENHQRAIDKIDMFIDRLGQQQVTHAQNHGELNARLDMLQDRHNQNFQSSCPHVFDKKD